MIERYFMGTQRPIAGPLKVYQKDKLIGTVPAYPVASTSGIFDVRPTDFTPTERDGETVLEAHWSICPGDFACIAGFCRADERSAAYSDRRMADEFDAFAAVTKSPLSAMKATVDKALKRPA